MIVGNTEGVKKQLEEAAYLGHNLASAKNMVLYEDKRTGTKTTMEELLEGLPAGMLRNNTAIMLNNTRKYFDSLEETTKLINIGDFEKYAFPIVRTIFPNLAAQEIASVQPMLGPISQVFYMKYIYGLTKGSAVAGTDIIENPNEYYSSEDIDEEQLDEGDGATTTLGTGTLSYTPVKPGTLVLTTKSGAVDLEITDDGNGALIGDIGSGTNTINYVTGAVAVDWSSAPDLGEAINAAYSYDLEGNDTIPEVIPTFTSAPVTARTRKLRTRWSLEASQDLRNLHGLDAEVEQVAGISNELKFEIDREIVNNIKNIAVNIVAAFSKTPDTGVSYAEHKLGFVDKLIEASNSIFSSTQRALGTFVICGINVASLIESLPGFVPMPRPKGTRAVYKCGVLNGSWDIWKDPNYSTNEFLMGYSGDSMYEVGYIFAPYIMAFTTMTIMLDDFIARKGMASRYGKKAIDGRFYCKGSITT